MADIQPVGLSGAVPSELADHDDVERCVGLAVANAIEPVSLLTLGIRIEW